MMYSRMEFCRGGHFFEQLLRIALVSVFFERVFNHGRFRAPLEGATYMMSTVKMQQLT